MVTVFFGNPYIGDLFTVVLGCLSGASFPVGFAYATKRQGEQYSDRTTQNL